MSRLIEASDTPNGIAISWVANRLVAITGCCWVQPDEVLDCGASCTRCRKYYSIPLKWEYRGTAQHLYKHRPQDIPFLTKWISAWTGLPEETIHLNIEWTEE